MTPPTEPKVMAEVRAMVDRTSVCHGDIEVDDMTVGHLRDIVAAYDALRAERDTALTEWDRAMRYWNRCAERIGVLEAERDAAARELQSVRDTQTHTIEVLEADLHAVHARAAKAEAERDAAVREREDMAPLARLGLWTLEKIRGVYAGDIDAFAVQEEAERLGVIRPVEAPKPCGDCCGCAEMDADICYRDTEATARYRAAVATAQGERE